MNNQQRIDKMIQLLQQALAPTQLSISDESEQHRGHAGAKSGKGHFSIIIASPHFAQKSLLATHRLVYAALGDMMTHDIHALRIQINKC